MSTESTVNVPISYTTGSDGLTDIVVTTPDGEKHEKNNAKPGTEAHVYTDPDGKFCVYFTDPEALKNEQPAPKPGPTPAPPPPSPTPAPPPPSPTPAPPPPKEKGQNDTPKDDYSSPYEVGDVVDDKMIDGAVAKGAKKDTVDGKEGVTLPDGTFLEKGQKLTQDNADHLTASKIEHHGKGLGYYHEGDKITDQLKHDLVDKGWKVGENGTLTSPDGTSQIGKFDTKLSAEQAQRLTEGGVKKSPEYVEHDSDSPANKDALGTGEKFVKADDASMKTYGIEDLSNGEHEVQIAWTKKSDKDVGIVKQFNPDSGNYEITGEVWPQADSPSTYKYTAYSADQSRLVNVDHSKKPGEVW